MAGLSTQDDCGRPTCNRPPEKTYTGEHGNTIRLCKKCYYNAVVRGRSMGLNTVYDPRLGRKKEIDVGGQKYQG